MKDIDGIVRAASPEEAVRATRSVLERAGVSVRASGEPYRRSASGLSVTEADVITMAFEARDRATRSRLTLSELVEGLSVVASLPVAGATRRTGPVAAAGYEYRGQDLQWIRFINEWVAVAARFHNSSDGKTTPVTSPPLYLAALAMRQQDPVDLREPFLSRELRLGSLDTILLLAGLRSALLTANGSAFPLPRGTGLLEGGAAISGVPGSRTVQTTSPIAFVTQAPSAECEALKRSLSATSQAGVDAAGFVVGEGLEAGLAAALSQLGGGGSNWVAAIGPLFDAAGIIMKWLSLMVLYDPDNLQLQLQINPETVHKPTAAPVIALATLKAEVPEDRWRELRRRQAENPVLNLLKGCARSLGLPVPADLASVGGAMGNWHVQWSIPQGAPSHVKLNGSTLSRGGLGRLESEMQAVGDHAGQAEAILDVQRERQRDHPGEEVAARVEVCGAVRTDEPPNLQTWLNAGWAGYTREVSTLLLAVSDLLAGMVQNAFTLDVCGHGFVTYHIPSQGTWRGKITIKSDRTTSRMTNSSHQGLTTRFFERESLLATDQVYVWTKDAGQRPGLVQSIFPMEARQYTHGGYLKRSATTNIGRGARLSSNRQFLIGCDYTDVKVDEAYGGWAFDTDQASASLTLYEDGRYELRIATSTGDEGEITVPAVSTHVHTPEQGRDCKPGSSDVKETTASPSPVVAWGGGTVKGSVDRNNPGNKISGSTVVVSGDAQIAVQWELLHDGPIRLPSR